MKAMIFSAGLGTRFKPWTLQHPKALAPVNGKSLLQRNIEYLQQYGITDVVVNVHHFADQIIDAIQKNNGWGSRITISDETNEVLETGGGLLKARTLLEGNEPFLTLNVDILTDLNIDKLLQFHQSNNALISFGITDRKSSRNLLFNTDHRLVGWKNNSTGEIRMADKHLNGEESFIKPFAYSCVVVFQPQIFSLINQTGKFSIIDTYLDLGGEHRIMGFDHSGDRLVDVGKPESVAVAEALFP